MFGRMVTVFTLILGVAVTDTSTAFAQQAREVVAHSAIAQGTVRIPNGTVDINLRDISIADALDQISERSGIAILYDRRTPGITKVINAQVSGATPMGAVEIVLKGTNLRAVRTQSGQVVVSAIAARKAGGMAQGVIVGRVSDARTGKGVSGAQVSIGSGARGITTGEDGLYRLTGVTAGSQTLVVRLVGYAKQTRTVTVGEGATVTVDFKLEPSANVLDQVVVTGTVASTELKAVPSAMTVITAKQIEERGITRIDQLFRGEIPGLVALELGTNSPTGINNASLNEVIMYSRGATKLSTLTTSAIANTNSIKTYIDGVEMTNSQYLSQIDPKSIERIEVLTGPQASTVYGANAINGVMQIFTKRGNTARPTVTVNLAEGFAQNNFSSGLASSHQYDAGVSGMEGRLSYNVGGGWDYTGAWSPGKQMQRTSVYGGTRYQAARFSIDANARQGWTQNRQGGDVIQVRTELAQDGVFDRTRGFSGLATPRKASLNGKTVGLTAGYTPFSWWSHQLTLGTDVTNTESLGSAVGFSSTSDTTFGNSQNKNSNTSQTYSSTLRLGMGGVSQTTLTYGADHRRTNSTLIGWEVAQGSTSLINPSVTRSKPDKNSGAYVQGQLGVWDALFFTYGVRADWNPNYGERAKVRPGRYGVSYAKEYGAVSAKLRGSYGRSIRPPAAGQIQGSLILPTNATNTNTIAFYVPTGSDLYLTLPNAELGPEFQQGGEGGLELYFGSRGSLVLTRYNQTVDGLVNLVSNVDSLRALEPGRSATSIEGCSPANTDPVLSPRSDGYCYLLQRQNLNVGSIRNQGWEMQSSVNIGPFTTRGTYSLSKSRVIGVTQRYRALLTNRAFTPGQAFAYAPEHTWSLNTSYARQGTSMLLNLSGIGQSLRIATEGDLSPMVSGLLRLRVNDAVSFADLSSLRVAQQGYVTANMTMSQRFTNAVDATLQITNLTDHYQNDVSALYPVLGRQTRIGLRIRK